MSHTHTHTHNYTSANKDHFDHAAESYDDVPLALERARRYATSIFGIPIIQPPLHDTGPFQVSRSHAQVVFLRRRHDHYPGLCLWYWCVHGLMEAGR